MMKYKRNLLCITALLAIFLLAPVVNQGNAQPKPPPPPKDGQMPPKRDGEKPPQRDSGASKQDVYESVSSATSGRMTIKAEVWADNWFAFYLGETLVQEDSVSITTERSFNAEVVTFQADYPMMLNFVVKDFKENDSGLEYIGTRKQQMGDGGFIAQFTDTTTGNVVAVTNSEWKCMVVHEAPLNKSCAREANPVAGTAPCDFVVLDEPDDWKTVDFDESAWKNATEYTTAQVSPKNGYDRISWDPRAKLIWTSDLETHNTLLCRLKLTAP